MIIPSLIRHFICRIRSRTSSTTNGDWIFNASRHLSCRVETFRLKSGGWDAAIVTRSGFMPGRYTYSRYRLRDSGKQSIFRRRRYAIRAGEELARNLMQYRYRFQ